ncbi:hypothetical protein EDB89DRAFT_1906002 [Lactarius sanguifluus]|nr:hypothetical protein EDB89DRAFT_1906002 [Lactarius sanguifluus]
MAARRETKDLMWKGEHMSYYLVFLDRLERLGEAAMNTGGGKDGQVAMDVDPPPKRQRTGDYTPTSLSSPVSSVPSVAVPSRSMSTPQRRAQLQQASKFPTPRQPSAVPPSPITPGVSTMSAPPIPTNSASVSSPVQAQASAGLAALESALATFPYPLPPTNTDRLASIRAAKVAILNGQHQLPGRPAPIGGSNSFGGGGGPSRGGGGARK